MRLLITGGAGFIGSNLILYWLEKYPEDEVLNIDKLTYASNLCNLSSIEGNANYSFKKIDIIERDKVREILRGFKPQGVIHLAAESHVDNSINGPEIFVLSNVIGTFNLLEECRLLWGRKPFDLDQNRFHHISTDEVYGMLDDSGYFSEITPYSPNSPYSATKAASDHLVRAYSRTYGMNTIITNCSNNFGPHQHEEKFIPTIIKNALEHKQIPVYGKGENVRDWLYVKEHCRAIDLVFHSGKKGESFNIGCHNEWKNIDLVYKICNILNELVGKGPNSDYKNLIAFVSDRLGHDYRYAVDTKKVENELGWKGQQNFDEDLRTTILWYLERYI